MPGNLFHGILLAAVSCTALAACQTPLSAPANGDAGRAVDTATAVCYTEDDCGPGEFCNFSPIWLCGGAPERIAYAGGECHALVCAGPGCSAGFQCANDFDCDPYSWCYSKALDAPEVCTLLPVSTDRPVCTPDCPLVHLAYRGGSVCLCPHC
jgi:hypothetical protein